MAEQKNKLIFTSEGRNLLVSQENGVRFAIIGAVLIQGLPPVALDKLFDTYKGLKLEELAKEPGIIFGLKNVSYESKGNQKVIPVDRDDYETKLDDINNNVLPVHYIPSLELVDDKTNPYGTYELDIDRTTLTWDNGYDISFAHVGLIGKQYAETTDAVFNVDRTQKPVLVALAQFEGDYNAQTGVFKGGIQILKDQNKYVAAKVQLRMTVTDHDFDFESAPSFNPDEPATKEILDISKKISLVNNGIKTMDDKGVTMRLAVTDDNTVVDDLRLNDNGSYAITKSLMVAAKYDPNEIENQFNAAALVHAVNKKDVENDNGQAVIDDYYKHQYVLTTVEQPDDYIVDALTAYSVGLRLKATGATINDGTIDFSDVMTAVFTGDSGNSGSSGGSGSSGNFGIVSYTGIEAPIFQQLNIPDYDQVAVDFFGESNNILDTGNVDKMIFSKNNVSLDPVDKNDYGYNVLFNSTNNLFSANGGNTNNTLIRSDYNIIKNESFSNLLIGADGNNIFRNANTNALICSDLNTLAGLETCGNIVIGGNSNLLTDCNSILMLGGIGLKASNVFNELILGQYNKNVQADIIFGNGTDDDNRKNALEFYADQGLLKLYRNGTQVAALGGTVGLETNALSVNVLTANNINNINFTGNYSLINRYTQYNSNGQTVFVDSLGTHLGSYGYISWGANTSYDNQGLYAFINEHEINLRGITATNGQLLLNNPGTYQNITINSNGINISDGINGTFIDNTSKSIVFYDNQNNKIKVPSFRKFSADIFVKATTSQTPASMEFMLGNCFDSGESNLSNSPMYIAISNWVNYCMLGYCNHDGEDSNTYYWLNNMMIKGADIDTPDWVWNTTNTAAFKFFDNSNKKKPICYAVVPYGYNEIEINIYFLDISSHDFVFTLVPVTNYNQVVRFKVTINQGGSNGGEDIRFWRNKNWTTNDIAGINEVWQNTLSYAEFDNGADTYESSMLLLNGVAVPSVLVTDWSMQPPVIGWHYARYT